MTGIASDRLKVIAMKMWPWAGSLDVIVLIHSKSFDYNAVYKKTDMSCLSHVLRPAPEFFRTAMSLNTIKCLDHLRGIYELEFEMQSCKFQKTWCFRRRQIDMLISKFHCLFTHLVCMSNRLVVRHLTNFVVNWLPVVPPEFTSCMQCVCCSY